MPSSSLALTRPTPPAPPPAQIEGARLTLRRDEEIFSEGEPARYVYQLVSGVVRTSRLMRDGRRQIDAFHFAGDLFGLEAGEIHRITAETLTGAVVVRHRSPLLDRPAAEDGETARRFLTLALEELGRGQDHVLTLGRRGACERVAVLLLELAERTGAEALLDVPMSRQDMADYLGLTIETVSRCLGQLQQDGVIALPAPRKILLRDRRVLERMAA